MPVPYPLTVVMPTLGGDTLKGTIEQLNRGTIYPAEILVCIPEREASRAANLPFANVKVIVTGCRGQVAQRAIGFQNASENIVMQLDDDIRVGEKCVAYLLQTLRRYSPRVAVAPALWEEGADTTAKFNSLLFLKIFYFLMNGREGFRIGAVSRAGVEFCCDRSSLGGEVQDVDWVPGGCVLHFRENLIRENYFPFMGKAYCEDLLHSHYLREKGVKLKIDTRAICSLEHIPLASHRFGEFIKTVFGDYRARKYYVKVSSRNQVRLLLFYLAWIVNYFAKKIFLKTRE